MKYAISYLVFVLAGIWISTGDFSFVGHPPSQLTLGKALCMVIPTIFAAFLFYRLAKGNLYARGVGTVISRERNPRLFYCWASFYLLCILLLYWVSRYASGI